MNVSIIVNKGEVDVLIYPLESANSVLKTKEDRGHDDKDDGISGDNSDKLVVSTLFP